MSQRALQDVESLKKEAREQFELARSVENAVRVERDEKPAPLAWEPWFRIMMLVLGAASDYQLQSDVAKGYLRSVRRRMKTGIDCGVLENTLKLLEEVEQRLLKDHKALTMEKISRLALSLVFLV